MNPPCPLVDTHAHLADPRLTARLDEVLAAAALAGVGRIVAVATTAADTCSVIAIAREHPTLVVASAGIHPNEAADAADEDWATIACLAGDDVVVAIGETGLDRHWDRTPFPQQQDLFDRHLLLAHDQGLPVIIHSRDCHRDTIEQLRRPGRQVRGVLHSFTGTWDEAEEFLALGLHISFAGMLTFANKSLESLRVAAARVPLDRLLVETDSPYLSPAPHRGQTNEPARVVHTAARLAELRGIALQELAGATTANATKLFRRATAD